MFDTLVANSLIKVLFSQTSLLLTLIVLNPDFMLHYCIFVFKNLVKWAKLHPLFKEQGHFTKAKCFFILLKLLSMKNQVNLFL